LCLGEAALAVGRGKGRVPVQPGRCVLPRNLLLRREIGIEFFLYHLTRQRSGAGQVEE